MILVFGDKNGATPLHYSSQMCGYDGKKDPKSTKLALDILNILLKHPKVSVEVEDKDVSLYFFHSRFKFFDKF